MQIGVMQPYFLPYIGYWQLLNKVDKYILYDDVNYIKGGWINRNNILIGNSSKYITLNLEGASPNKLINEIELSKNNIWKNKLIKTIEINYKKAPFFLEVFPIIKTIIENDENNLAKYLEFSIKKICEYLKINTEILISSHLKKNNNLRGEEKVIDICKQLSGTEYYNAIGGQELYSYENFEKNGLKLKFLKSENILYKQFTDKFVPNLSILDILMFNSKEEIKILLNKFIIIDNKKVEVK